LKNKRSNCQKFWRVHKKFHIHWTRASKVLAVLEKDPLIVTWNRATFSCNNRLFPFACLKETMCVRWSREAPKLTNYSKAPIIFWFSLPIEAHLLYHGGSCFSIMLYIQVWETDGHRTGEFLFIFGEVLKWQYKRNDVAKYFRIHLHFG